jgi:hypothetical protein
MHFFVTVRCMKCNEPKPKALTLLFYNIIFVFIQSDEV